MTGRKRPAAVDGAGGPAPSVLRLWLRRFVLATSVPPLLRLYREGYAVAVRIALRIFRRYPEVKAVYLRRGAAAGGIIPLVSDLDFAVVSDPLAPADRAELESRFETLARRTTFVDRSLEIYDEAELRKLYATNPHFQYRFTEGKAAWKLLYGDDVLRRLPPLSRDELDGGCYVEIHVWWAHFAWRLLQDRKYATEAVTRNTVCFKALSETIKMERAIQTGTLVTDRAEALRSAIGLLEGPDRALADKLLWLQRKRFRPATDRSLVEETQAVLLRRIDAFCDRFRRHPLGTDNVSMGPSIARLSSPPAERLDQGGIREYAASVTASLVDEWGDAFRGARLAQSVHFNIDEWLLLLDADPRHPPSAVALTRLNRRHIASRHPAARRVNLFVRLRSAAFQIDIVDLTNSWQSILNPSANPDVYLALGGADARVGASPAGTAEPVPLPKPPVWTPLVARFVRHEKMLFRELLDWPAVYKLDALAFLRVFWKMAQLVVVNRSATTDRMLFPMTPGAIRRALDEQGGAPMPWWLASLEEAYPRALTASSTTVSERIPEAVHYLKEIDA